MQDWTPQSYQLWWTAILSPFKPWIVAGVIALCIDAACSLVMVLIWIRGSR